MGSDSVFFFERKSPLYYLNFRPAQEVWIPLLSWEQCFRQTGSMEYYFFLYSRLFVVKPFSWNDNGVSLTYWLG